MDTSLLEIFSARLRETRGDMMQATFAQKIGVSRASLSSYENGTRIPDIETLKHIHEETGVSLYYLLGLTDSRDDALATAQRATGLSDECLQVLESDQAARYFVERILLSPKKDRMIKQTLRYQLDTCQSMELQEKGQEDPVPLQAQALHAANAAKTLRQIFSAKNVGDKPEIQWAYAADKKSTQEELEEEADMLVSIFGGFHMHNTFSQYAAKELKEAEVPDAQETPEQ